MDQTQLDQLLIISRGIDPHTVAYFTKPRHPETPRVRRRIRQTLWSDTKGRGCRWWSDSQRLLVMRRWVIATEYVQPNLLPRNRARWLPYFSTPLPNKLAAARTRTSGVCTTDLGYPEDCEREVRYRDSGPSCQLKGFQRMCYYPSRFRTLTMHRR